MNVQAIGKKWPKWLRENVEPKIKELEGKVVTEIMNIIKGKWTVICGRCGTLRNVEIGSEELDKMLRQGYIEIECTNSECTDFIFLRHKGQITLTSLLQAIVTAPRQHTVTSH